MKLHHLFESTLDVSAEKLVQLISAAQPFFKKVHYQPGIYLYRGSNRLSGSPFIVTDTRKDRTPTDTPQFIHDLLDKRFEQQFHIPMRSQSVFVTGDSTFAAGYGPACIMLPVGQFEFCWGINAQDAFLHFEPPTDLNADIERETDLNGDNFSPALQQRIVEWFNRYWDSAEYTNQNIEDAIKSGHEIMVACDRYILVNPHARCISYPTIVEASKLIGINLPEHVRPSVRLDQFKTTIPAAISHLLSAFNGIPSKLV